MRDSYQTPKTTFEPLEHQALAIEHLFNNERALLFAGMGLGKTAAVLETTRQLICDGSMKGLLVVAPKRVATISWPAELEKWSNFHWLRFANLRTKEGQEAWRQGKAEIFVINYEMLPKFCNEHLKGVRQKNMPVDSILFDEIDMAKNHKSKRTNALKKYLYKFPRRWGMTGTPVSNSTMDIYNQVRLIDDGKAWVSPINPNGRSFTNWKNQFFYDKTPSSDFPNFALRDGSEGLIEKRIEPLTLVLLSKDYLKIPPVHVHDIEVKLPANVQKVYNKLQKTLIQEYEEGFDASAANLAVLRGKLLQVTSGNIYVQQGDNIATKRVEFLHDEKLKAIEAIQEKHKGKPLFVACLFRHEVEAILARFDGAVEMPDSTDSKASQLREKEIFAKWDRGEIPVLVAHPKKGSHGLNLQKGSNVVIWSTLIDSLGTYDQWNARLARQGQTEETHIYRIFAGAVDHAVEANLHNKDTNQKAVLNTIKGLKRFLEARL